MAMVTCPSLTATWIVSDRSRAQNLGAAKRDERIHQRHHSKRQDRRDVPVQLGGWTFDYDNTAYLMYHSGEHWNPYDHDPKLDSMLEAQRLIADRTVREQKLQEIAHYVADNALEIPMFNLNTIYGLNKRVQGFVPPPDNRIRLMGVSVE
jgi:ABC-type transport system substrate-binding protein